MGGGGGGWGYCYRCITLLVLLLTLKFIGIKIRIISLPRGDFVTYLLSFVNVEEIVSVRSTHLIKKKIVTTSTFTAFRSTNFTVVNKQNT